MSIIVHFIHVVPSPPRKLSITKVFKDGIDLNWLPPTEPNGEVLHYVIYYAPEGVSEQNSSTGSNLTHYNLTGLERNSVYTNIAVQAVNTAGRSDRSAVIAQYNHTPPGESCDISMIISSAGTILFVNVRRFCDRYIYYDTLHTCRFFKLPGTNWTIKHCDSM